MRGIYGNEIKTSFFSDSLIVSEPINSYWSFVEIIRNLWEIQLDVFRFGMAIRGAISVGNMIHDGDIAFGLR